MYYRSQSVVDSNDDHDLPRIDDHDLPLLLEDMSLVVRIRMWSLHNEASSHFRLEV